MRPIKASGYLSQGLLWFVLGTSLLAFTQTFRFSRVGLREGLSHNTVYGLLQDRDGFLWVSTGSGLNRYDGYGFKTFHHDPRDPHSLSDSSTGRMVADPDGRLWIGTWGGGLNRLDPATGRFTRYQHQSGDSGSLPGNRIQSLCIDDAGVLWVGTYGAGLARFDPEGEKFIRFPHREGDPNSPAANRIWSIVSLAGGKLLLGTDGGLSLFDTHADRFTHFHHNPANPNSLSHDRVKYLLPARDGQLWIGTQHGLTIADPQLRRFRRYYADPINPNSLSHNNIHTLFQDHNGMLWIGTEGGGLTLTEPGSEKFIRLRQETNNPYSLSDDSVEYLFEDRTHVLWVATLNGLNKIDLKPQKFEHEHHLPGDPGSLSHDQVAALYEDRAGVFWVATFGGGLNRREPGSQDFTHFTTTSGEGLQDDVVSTVLEDGEGRFWVGTYWQGLHRLDRQNMRFSAFRHDPQQPGSLSHNRVRCLLEDRDGVLWIGTDKGPNIWIGEGRFLNGHNDPFLAEHLGSLRVFAMIQDYRGDIWLGTDSGLVHTDAGRTGVRRYQQRDTDEDSLSNDRVFCLYQDRSGHLWIGTDAGLNRFERRSESFRRYFTFDGLPSNIITGILEDDAGMLWISTEGGLSCFDPRNERFRNYDIYDGLQDNGFHRGAAFRGPSGQLFFGGANGFNRFYPDRLADNPFVPPLRFTGLKKYDREVLLEGAVSHLTEIALDHRDKVFSLSFAALDFTHPQKNRYAARLLGFDQQWVSLGDQRQVTYTNLDPGKYVLQVKGSNNDNVWNQEPLTLKIRIRPPLWRTWWAYTFYGFLLVSAAVGLPQIRIHYLKKRRAALEALVLKRTRELETKNEQLAGKNHELQVMARTLAETHQLLLDAAHHAGMAEVATNVLHNVGNTLNSINTSTELLSEMGQSTPVMLFEKITALLEDNLNRIEAFLSGDERGRKVPKAMVDVSKSLRQVHRELRNETHNLRDNVAYLKNLIQAQQKYVSSEGLSQEVDLRTILEEALAVQRPRLEAGKVKVMVDFADIPRVKVHKSKFFRVLVNLLGNALDAMADNAGNRRLTLGCEVVAGEGLVLTIQDNGTGIAPEHMSRLFNQGFSTKKAKSSLGLHYSANVMKEMGGGIHARSDGPGKGAAFLLCIPCEEI